MEPEVIGTADDQTEDVEPLQPADEQPASDQQTTADASADDERAEWVKSLSTDQLLALHPGLARKIAGITGNLAQKQVKEIMAKELPNLTATIRNGMLADIQHAAEYDRLERLRTTDQYSFSEEMAKPEKLHIMMQGRQRQAPTQAEGGYPAEHVQWANTTMQAKMARISEKAQADLKKKSYDVSPEGRSAFESEADAIWLEEQIEKSLGANATAAQKRAAAEKLDSLADEQGDAPEVGTQRTTNGLMTYAQLRALPNQKRIELRKSDPVMYDRILARDTPRR